MKIVVLSGNPKKEGLCHSITDELIRGALLCRQSALWTLDSGLWTLDAVGSAVAAITAVGARANSAITSNMHKNFFIFRASLYKK
jgi:hypothetical protein